MPNFDDSKQEPTRPPGAHPEPARQRLGRHRRRHGDEHPAAQPRRGHRRHRPPHPQPGRAHRRPDAHRPRAPTSRPAGSSTGAAASRRRSAPAAARSSCARAWRSRRRRARASASRSSSREMPYQVNKARVHAKIGELMREKKIEGISEVRDESDRDGIRLVIELKKDVLPQVVINQLYRQTDLQTTFGVINLAIAQRPPGRAQSEGDARRVRRAPARRRHAPLALRAAAGRGRSARSSKGWGWRRPRSISSSRRSAKRATRRRARSLDEAPARGPREVRARAPAGRRARSTRRRRRARTTLSERQAKAILEMRLSRLTGLEQEKLATEYGTLCRRRSRASARILADAKLLFDVIVMELEEIRPKYADKRRTEIVANEAEIADEDLIQEEDMVVTISHAGYIKRTAPATYRAQKRGGKGKIGMEAREEDWVPSSSSRAPTRTSSSSATRARCYVKKVYEIPIAPRTAKGRAIVNFVGHGAGREGRGHRARAEDRAGTLRGDGHAARADQEDRAHRVRELPREGDHRRRRSRTATSSSAPR